MAKKTDMVMHLSSEELQQRYRACRSAKEARRWHVLWLLSTGKGIGETATLVGLGREWVRTVLQRYNAQGLDAVRDQHAVRPGGRRPALSAEQQTALRAALAAPPPDGGLWTGPKVARWIAEQTGTPTHPQLGWVYLRALGLTLKQPRPRHRDAASAEEQEAWKKN